MKIDNQKIEEVIIAIKNQLLGNWEMTNEHLHLCSDVLKKLQKGLLLELPCKVGDKVRILADTWGNAGYYVHSRDYEYIYGKIVSIIKTKSQTLIKIQAENNVSWERERKRFPISVINKTVFIEEQAEGVVLKEDSPLSLIHTKKIFADLDLRNKRLTVWLTDQRTSWNHKLVQQDLKSLGITFNEDSEMPPLFTSSLGQLRSTSDLPSIPLSIRGVEDDGTMTFDLEEFNS